MQIEYTIGKKDCYNFGKEILQIKKVKKKYSLLFYIPFLFFIISVISLFFPSYKVVSLLFNTTIILIIVCAYIYLLFFIGSTIGTYRRLKSRSLNATLNIDESGIRYNRGNISSDIQWESITDIYNTKNLLFIFVSSLEAIFIPKRIFANETELNNFWNLIVENYNKNH